MHIGRNTHVIWQKFSFRLEDLINFYVRLVTYLYFERKWTDQSRNFPDSIKKDNEKKYCQFKFFFLESVVGVYICIRETMQAKEYCDFWYWNPEFRTVLCRAKCHCRLLLSLVFLLSTLFAFFFLDKGKWNTNFVEVRLNKVCWYLRSIGMGRMREFAHDYKQRRL